MGAMKRKGKKQILQLIALSFASFVLAAIAGELLVEYLYNREQARIASKVEPTYS